MPEYSSITVADQVITKMYLQRERELAAALRISEALSQRMKLQDLVEQAQANTKENATGINPGLITTT